MSNGISVNYHMSEETVAKVYPLEPKYDSDGPLWCLTLDGPDGQVNVYVHNSREADVIREACEWLPAKDDERVDYR